MSRVFLIGLNNTRSPLERHALLPYPAGCTGHRILTMIQEVDPSFTRDDYLEKFERRNLWPGTELPEGRGSRTLYRREGRLRLTEVCRTPSYAALLGARVWNAVLDIDTPAKFSCVTVNGSTFYYVPHPSGRNRVYNEPKLRQRAGELLLDLLNADTVRRNERVR